MMISRLFNNKKAQGEVLPRFVELGFVVIFIFLIIFISLKVLAPFFLPDAVSYNFYKSYSSNLKSLIENPADGRSYKTIFSYTCNDDKEETAFKDFQGTIYLVSTNGEISLPFPELERFETKNDEDNGKWNHWATTNNQGKTEEELKPYQLFSVGNENKIYFPREKLSGDCTKTACICFSKKSLVDDEVSDSTIMNILANPYKCKSFDIPENVKTVFFEKKDSFTKEKFEELCSSSNENSFFNLVLESKLDSSVENQQELIIYYSLESPSNT